MSVKLSCPFDVFCHCWTVYGQLGDKARSDLQKGASIRRHATFTEILGGFISLPVTENNTGWHILTVYPLFHIVFTLLTNLSLHAGMTVVYFLKNSEECISQRYLEEENVG